jgi:hypothetical protein
MRVKMGIKSRSLLQSLQSDPREFLKYMALLPPIPMAQQSNDDDFFHYSQTTDDDRDDDKAHGENRFNLTNEKHMTKDFVDVYGRYRERERESMFSAFFFLSFLLFLFWKFCPTKINL